MKKLYKRISAILLAGAIIFGGAFSSGLSVHADYVKVSINHLSDYDQSNYKNVKQICDELGVRVRGIAYDKPAMNELVRKVFPKRQALRNKLLKMDYSVMSIDALEYYLKSEKSKGVKFLKLEFGGLEYLFFL